MDNYIFGYGSLICADSRTRTGQTGTAIPVTVRDIARSWSVPVMASKTTAVGALETTGALCNGVIFKVSQDTLTKFDLREVGYDRITLSKDRFTAPEQIPDNSRIWTYVGHQVQQPSNDMPIAQSYLDVIINGCMQYGTEFVTAFFKHTAYWQHLMDDRMSPVYPRPLRSTSDHEKFDAWLATMVPTALASRRPATQLKK